MESDASRIKIIYIYKQKKRMKSILLSICQGKVELEYILHRSAVDFVGFIVGRCATCV